MKRSMWSSGHTLGYLPSIQFIRELRVLIFRNLILFMIMSGSFGTNTTVPSETTLPPSFQLNNTEPQPTETKEIIEIITETIIYTELPEEDNVFEVFNEAVHTTSQLRDIDVVAKTQISAMPSTSITNGVTTTPTKATVSTMSTTTEIPTTQRPSSTPTVFRNQNSNSVTDLAENSAGTTLFSDFTTKSAISTITSTTISPDITTTQTEQTSSISTNLATVVQTEIISTRKDSTSSSTSQNTQSITSKPSIRTTNLPIPEYTTNVSSTQRTNTQTTQQREHLSSSASPQISTRIPSTNIYFPNSTTERISIINSTTDRIRTVSANKTDRVVTTDRTITTKPADVVSTDRTISTIPVSINRTISTKPVDLVTTTSSDNENTTIRYVDGDPADDSRDDLPILLIVIASTVAILVTLLLLCFVLIMCVAKKHQQRKNANYYDHKKRWVKKAPERPKYEKVNQHLTYDQEAAGAGWVFRDGNDPSKQITLELRPRHAQSPPGSPLDFPDTDSSKARNLDGALSENFPPDLLSVSQEGGLDLDLNFGSLGSLRGLSKGLARSNRSIRSSSSEGDSGILALGEEAWSPTKGVPFHFISDDAVIEL